MIDGVAALRQERFAPTDIFPMLQTSRLKLLYHKFLRHSNPFREKAAAVDCIAIHAASRLFCSVICGKERGLQNVDANLPGTPAAGLLIRMHI